MRNRNTGAKEHLVFFPVGDVEGIEFIRSSTRLNELLSSANGGLFSLLSMEGLPGQGSGQVTIREIPSNPQDEQ